MSKLHRFALLLVAAALAASQTPNARANPPSIVDFVGAQYDSMRVSRNGRVLLARVPSNGRSNLAVIELESMTRRMLTSYADRDVIDAHWSGSDRIVYRVSSADLGDEDAGSALRMVTRDGARRVSLFEPDKETAGSRVGRYLRFSRTLPASEAEILVTGNLRDPHAVDVYRINLDTAQRTLLTESRPDGVLRYTYDRARVPRAAVSAARGTTTRIVHVRASASAPWQEVLRYDITRPGTIEPLRFTADGRRLLVSTNVGRETMALHYYDPQERRLLQLAFEHPAGDIDADARGGASHMVSSSTDADTEEVMGFLVRSETPRVAWNTESDRRFQRAVDGFLPDTYNSSTALRGDSSLVSAVSPVWPTTWHIYDEGKGTLEDLLASRPALLPDKLAPMRPFELRTRDGLILPSHYLLPRGAKRGDRLPTVVLLHDDPSLRSIPSSFNRTLQQAQVLSSRGYAVVLPALRGTAGFNNRVFYAGFGALGRQSIDDVVDAASWAVREGVADPSRVCVGGTAFGGYAALMAAARAPQAFRCVAVAAPIADLGSFLTSERSEESAYPNRVAFWLALAGAPNPGALAVDLSPVGVAAQIKQPVLLHWAPGDANVPFEQTQRIADALAKAGNAPRRAGAEQAAAGSTPLSRRVDHLQSIVDFLDGQIGSKRSRP
jgi:dipeptidyl aminopeptidase/acylaminoacyl peptidase